MLVMGIILFIVAGFLLLYGIMNLFQKGFLLNNAYLFASKKEKEEMNKKPFYIQSGIAIIMISIVFMFEGFYCLLDKNIFFILSIAVAILAVLYAVISTYVIYLKTKKK